MPNGGFGANLEMFGVSMVGHQESLVLIGELHHISMDIGFVEFHALYEFASQNITAGEETGVRNDDDDMEFIIDGIIIDDGLFYYVTVILNVIYFDIIDDSHLDI